LDPSLENICNSFSLSNLNGIFNNQAGHSLQDNYLFIAKLSPSSSPAGLSYSSSMLLIGCSEEITDIELLKTDLINTEDGRMKLLNGKIRVLKRSGGRIHLIDKSNGKILKLKI
jgi:hypothetical protein